MSNSIFQLNNGKLIELNEQSYISEDMLQQLLSDYPSLIPGSQIDAENPRRWLLISREYGVPDKEQSGARWSLDHLFLDQEGIPTLVEVKRSTDTRIRREVIGQILDYAANAVLYWSIEDIINKFELGCAERSQDASVVMGEFLESGIDATSFWEIVKTNLKAGKIRLLIVADSIPRETQRIIEFLNGQMTTAEILGVEVKQFIGQNTQTLVAKVIGQTATAQTTKKVANLQYNKWTQESFFDELAKKSSPEEIEVVKRILEWGKVNTTRVWFGEGKTIGSMVPILNRGKDHQLFAVWTTGVIELYFYWYKTKKPFDSEEMRLQLLEKLNRIPNIEITIDKISKRPSFPLKLLVDLKSFEFFIDSFEWFIEEVKKANHS